MSRHMALYICNTKSEPWRMQFKNQFTRLRESQEGMQNIQNHLTVLQYMTCPFYKGWEKGAERSNTGYE